MHPICSLMINHMPSFIPHFAEPFKQNDASKFADSKDINITNLNAQFAKRIFCQLLVFAKKLRHAL
jgi:hypothetical protein